MRMILSTSYNKKTDIKRDLLAGFSAIDHATSEELDPEVVEDLVVRLILRLSVLCSLHGPQGVPQLHAAIRDVDGLFDSVCLAVNGQDPKRRTTAVIPRELQQELVHFSRIVDVGTAGFGTPVPDTKRLRNSHAIPVSLKVLAELMVVVRGRLAQRSAAVVTPALSRRPETCRFDIGSDVLAQFPENTTDHVLIIEGDRRRTRRKIGFLFSQLLVYLPPRDVFAAVAAYLVEARLATKLRLRLLECPEPERLQVHAWSYDAETVPREAFAAASTLLPISRVFHVFGPDPTTVPLDLPGTRVGVRGGEVFIEGDLDHAATVRIVAPSAISRSTVEELVEKALQTWGQQDVGENAVLSVECGHIHLDRQLDIDQVAGARIGAALLRSIADAQAAEPVLAPMMDDDHVMVALRPTEYRDFLRNHFPTTPFSLIPESSPIVRAITCVLFHRLRTGPHQAELATRGGNLFLRLPDGSFCELFESFDGEPVSGCVLFETALLVYRTAPAVFDDYAMNRFPTAEDVHTLACRVLDGDDHHDAKVAELARLYSPFAEVTDPQKALDSGFDEIVSEVLDTVSTHAAHLNVLEDYYEVQQDKVRQLLAVLELPFIVRTLFFNTQTGRIHAAG
ncbi:hypothetical protein [Actinoalloteichus fjordicus]|uniref:Uncharacterized protein n=1 Tax=Actinoalloteichus fjordicus TaxID=1612552 RepID=A0AAC9LCE8_9PSEU|nr:hypothetical protein [Actinoalloteichus fjordicus]APU15253.1 hypothetical protein UA74_16025 [Actinoalloteichus fjordicus]